MTYCNVKKREQMRKDGAEQWGCLNPPGHWTQGSKLRLTWVNWDVCSPYAKVNVEFKSTCST